ncbi:MAG: DUF6036 family nucleotidyltransferase [Polyangiales bacterium]|nr:nucleotidyl transferase AbiEii/AbiGii toxin family protein [Myxococcales bacterium]
MSSDAERVLADLIGVLRPLGVRWYLFGAQAALLRGSRRLTADVDVTVFLGRTGQTQLLSALESGGFQLRVPDADDFAARTRVLPVTHRATHMPVDVVLGGPGIEEHFLSRVDVLLLGEVEVPTPCAEDLVVMKLLAGRGQDLEDAKALVKTGADLGEIRSMIEAIAEGLGEDDVLASFDELRRRLSR